MKILTNISLIFLLISCANMVAPTGGDTDLDSPQLLNTVISEDSRNIIKRTIIFEFDEYVQLNRWHEINQPYSQTNNGIVLNLQKHCTKKFLGCSKICLN